MELKLLFIALIGIFLINHYILPRALKMPPFLSIFAKTKSAIAMGLAAIIIVILASLITFLLNQYILLEYNITYLRTIFLILIAASLGYSVKKITKKFSPSVYKSNDVFLTYLTIICTELSLVIAVLNIKSGFIADMKFSDAIIQGFAAGFVFIIILLLMVGILEKIEFAEVHSKLKGIPISILVASLLALAFFGFSGIKV
jgi:Na+-translocating ferredoxin:NAD+ oxidoreductase subunit A